MSGQPTVNQRSARAGHDMIAGDQTVLNYSVHNHHGPTAKATVVEQLLTKLQTEIDDNAQVRAMIDSLRYYYEHKSHDGIVGLEAKLEKGNRAHEIYHALEKKELFVKTLEKWSMYSSAQEIFVHLLARAEFEYMTHVFPQIETLSEVEINNAITTRIVEPIVVDCGASVFKLTHGTAMGMLYWLAEQCFVRWHK